MCKKILLLVVVAGISSMVFAEKITQGFEDKAILKKMEVEGDAALSTDQKHSGENSLYLPPKATAALRFGAENKYGSVTLWVYDSCVNNKASTPNKAWKGPYFGLINSDDDKVVLFPVWSKNIKPNDYAVCFTAENQWFDKWHSAIKRPEAGWRKFTFTFLDDKSLSIVADDDKEAGEVDVKKEFFKKGANGVCFGGGDDLGAKNEKFYYDDLEIDLKDAAK